MTYEIYRYLSFGLGAVSLVMLIVSTVLFIRLHIPSVISDLTGRTQRRGIENIRNQNSATGDKRHMPSAVNRRRCKVTDKISPSGNLMKAPKTNGFAPSVTEKIHNAQTPASETTVLDQGATPVLDQGATTVLDETQSPCPEPEPAQTCSAQPLQTEAPPESAAFSVDYEITYVHTDEVIS